MLPKLFVGLVGLTLTSATVYPYCKTGMFIPSDANCAKYEFHTAPIEPNVDITNGTTFYDISSFPPGSIDRQTERMALLITNVFENGNTIMGFAACAAIGDPRGFTAGSIGFTTGTNDAYRLITNYTATYPDNPLAKYLPELKRISNLPFSDLTGRNDTKGLPGYCEEWKSLACSKESFDALQLATGHDEYTIPAMRFAALVGITSHLGRAIFYDTIINHGWQYTEPKINIWRIINLTGPMMNNETEQSYLTRFLNTRRQLMCCWPDSAWPPAADRTVDLQTLVNDWKRNKDLSLPVTLKIYGVTVKGTESVYYDSQDCKVRPENDIPHSTLSYTSTMGVTPRAVIPTGCGNSTNCTGVNATSTMNSPSSSPAGRFYPFSSLLGVVVIFIFWLVQMMI